MAKTKEWGIALALSLLLLFSYMGPMQSIKRTQIAKAATKTIRGVEDYYVALPYTSPKKGARYSCVITNKKVAKFCRGEVGKHCMGQTTKKESIFLVLQTLKAGKTKVKIKETYKTKTKTVASYKVVVKKTTNTEQPGFVRGYLPYKTVEKEVKNTDGTVINTMENEYFLQLEKGMSINLKKIVYATKGSDFCTVENPAVAAISNGMLTAKTTGETTLKLKKASEVTSDLKLVVVEPSQTAHISKAKEIGKKLDELYNKKLTVKNVIRLYNRYVSYMDELKKINKDALYDPETNTFIGFDQHITNEYMEKFMEVAAKKVGLQTMYGASLEGMKIMSATTKKIKITFKKPVSQYQILVNNIYRNQKITKNSRLIYNVSLVDAYYGGEIKVGKRSATLKALGTVKKGKCSYCTLDKKGVTYNKVKVK